LRVDVPTQVIEQFLLGGRQGHGTNISTIRHYSCKRRSFQRKLDHFDKAYVYAGNRSAVRKGIEAFNNTPVHPFSRRQASMANSYKVPG
jgi:hypothetical protein